MAQTGIRTARGAVAAAAALVALGGAVAGVGPTPAPAGATATPTGRTDPSLGHPYRHGAVPRLSTASAPTAPTPDAAPRDNALPGLLSYGGGVAGLSGAGVTTGSPRVYLVFYGGQWGAESGSGTTATFAVDPDAVAPTLEHFFAGLGTDNEPWSDIVTQYCDGVASGATSCAGSSLRVPYPSAPVLAGVWYDDTTAATNATAAGATGHQLAAAAEAAAAQFGNTTQAANRDTQYVIVSPTGTNPDGWNNPSTGYCAYHDDTADRTIDGGGAVTGPDVAWTNMPYISDAGFGCGAGSVNSPGTNDGLTETASHEYAETLTDQFPQTNPAPGWTDTNGNEIADKCVYLAKTAAGAAFNLQLSTGGFAVQGLWSNTANSGAGGCVQTGLAAPLVTGFTPASAAVGANVTLTGSNLAGASVAFGGAPATVVSSTALRLVATVPPGAHSGPLSVTNSAGTGESATAFTVAPPSISSITEAKVGARATLRGQALSGATSVTFDGIAATIASDSRTALSAAVPAGAGPGPVTVTTPGGTATVSSYTPAPAITRLAPTKGPVGTTVTVTGTTLEGATAVTLDGTAVTVSSDTPTQVVFTVPAGALTGKVQVTTAGGTATSGGTFTVT
jgi:serine protease